MASGDRACRECGRRLEGGKRRPPLLWWLAGAGALLLAGGGVALGLLLGGGQRPAGETVRPFAAETAGLNQSTTSAAPTTTLSATTVTATTTAIRATTTTSTVVAAAQSAGSAGTPVRATLGTEIYLQVPPSGPGCTSWSLDVSPTNGVVTYLGCYRWQPSEPGQGSSYDEFTFRAAGIGRATVIVNRGSLRYAFAITVQR